MHLVVERERLRLGHPASEGDQPGDTVGAVALDGRGSFAAASSTGGRPGKPPGRVGDACVPGCGLYADDGSGAAACTGWGEHILRAGLARHAVDLGREHVAQDACWLALRSFETRLHGRAGIILLGRDGSIGWAFNTASMGVAYMAADLTEPVVAGIRPGRSPSG